MTKQQPQQPNEQHLIDARGARTILIFLQGDGAGMSVKARTKLEKQANAILINAMDIARAQYEDGKRNIGKNT